MMTPTTVALDTYRTAALNGTLTLDDMKAAVALLREDRMRAQVVSTKAKVKKVKAATAAAVTGDDLLQLF